jgi:hypothetical protein
MPKRTVIPSNIINCMTPEIRGQFGVKTIQEMADAEAVEIEDELRTQVLGYCYRHDLIVGTANPKRKSTYTKGWPDITILFPRAEILFAELKAHKGRLSAEQAAIGERMMAEGHRWRLINSYELFVAIANPLL